jgi:hypothetical protein
MYWRAIGYLPIPQQGKAIRCGPCTLRCVLSKFSIGRWKNTPFLGTKGKPHRPNSNLPEDFYVELRGLAIAPWRDANGDV